MVGSETALADDPSLTVRRGDKVLRTPTRVLVDGRLRVPATHQLFSDPGSAKTWVVCGTGARGIAKMRETAGSVIEIEKGQDRKLDLPAMAAALADSGLTTVLVEGGGGLAAALLRADPRGRGTLDARAEADWFGGSFGARALGFRCARRSGCDRAA